MSLLEETRVLTHAAWDEEWFRKVWDLVVLELQVAAKKGKTATQLLYDQRDKAQAVAAKLKAEGFAVKLSTGTVAKEQFSNFYVNVSWSEVE